MKIDYKSVIIGGLIGGLITFSSDLYLMNKQLKDNRIQDIVNEYISITYHKVLEYDMIHKGIDISQYKLNTIIKTEKAYGNLSSLTNDLSVLKKIEKKHILLLTSYSRLIELIKKHTSHEKILKASSEYHANHNELKSFLKNKFQ